MTEQEKQRVWVTMTTTAIDADGIQEDEQTLRFPAELSYAGDAYLLRYTERIEESDETEVRLRLRPGKVMMMRQGDYSVSLIFEVGKHYQGTYHTPYGELAVSVETLTLSDHYAEGRGEVFIRYDETISGEAAGVRTMRISFGGKSRR